MNFYAPDIPDSCQSPAALCGAGSDPGEMKPYTFRIAPARKQVCLTIAGFWSPETLADFAVDLFGAIDALGCAPGEHTLCCDVSNAAIQSQDVIRGFQKLIGEGPTRARKLALWTSRPVSRMQSRRLMAVRPDLAVFESEDEARRWLAA